MIEPFEPGWYDRLGDVISGELNGNTTRDAGGVCNSATT